jgi:uncharacterized protein YaaR (DUF327 family)
MKYFEVNYIKTENGEIIKQGNFLYYTSADENVDEIKKVVRNFLNEPKAIISIPLFTEIDRNVYLEKGGNPDIV